MKSISKILRLPGFGQAAFVLDPNGQANNFPGGISFHTQLTAEVIRDGKVLEAKDYMSRSSRFWSGVRGNDTAINLGSGLVTNVGVMALANDFNWANNCQTLKLANYHFFGTGTTTPAATDIAMQTISTNGGQTAATGVQTFISAANSQKYQSVGITAFSGNEAVTEWGLMTDSVLSSTTGSPLTAATATSATATGTPYTASSGSVRGQTQHIIVPGTTAVYGLITSNTNSVDTIPAWYKQSDGTLGSTPGATEAFTTKPVLWDHKTFAAVNVIAGDSIQLTYQLTVTSGG